MKPGVFDASCVLAVIRKEPGWEAIASLMPGAHISAVNVSEVAAKLAEFRYVTWTAREVLAELALSPEPFDLADAEDAGELRPVTSAQGLSLGDRACLALGRRMSGIVYTTDRAWRNVEAGVEIVIAR